MKTKPDHESLFFGVLFMLMALLIPNIFAVEMRDGFLQYVIQGFFMFLGALGIGKWLNSKGLL